jgi:hypothetical protein
VADEAVGGAVVGDGDVAAPAPETEAAAAALDVGCRASTVDEEDHLPAAVQTVVHGVVEAPAEDAAVAFAELAAHVDDLDAGERAFFV